jgi:hypothetical protein
MVRRLPDADEAVRILRGLRPKPPRRPPPPLGRALAPYVKGLESRFGAGPQLKARWREIAGETLARRTEPVRVIKGRAGASGVLEVKVDGAAATLLQHQAPELLQRVNLFLGADAVGRVRIVQGPVRPPAGEATSRPGRATLRPLSAAEEAALAASLADAPDGPLKTALERLGRSVLRRERDPPR